MLKILSVATESKNPFHIQAEDGDEGRKVQEEELAILKVEKRFGEGANESSLTRGLWSSYQSDRNDEQTDLDESGDA